MSKITRREFVKGAAALGTPLAFTPFTVAETSSADRFDVVVAGAGHNSLITACYLAKAGYRVAVLEGRAVIGGSTMTAEFILPGFHNDVCSTEHITLQDNPVLRDDELNLRAYGLEYIVPDPVFHVPFPDGSYITEWQDFDRTCEEIGKYSKKDAAAFRRMTTEIETIRPILRANMFMPPSWGKPVSQAVSKLPNAKFWQRRLGMSAWDILHDNFEDWRTITFMMAPWADSMRSHMTGLKAYGKCTRHPRSPLPKGGSGMLATALGRCLEAHGGVILVNKSVVRLIVENGKCAGVECADGSSYRATKAVVSTIHVKRLIEMAPSELWGEDFIDGVNTFKVGSGTFVVHLATTEPLTYAVKGGTLSPVHSTTLSSPERAARLDDDLTLGNLDLEDPVLHSVQCSVADPTRAPAGKHTIRIAGNQPWNLKDGGPKRWDEIKDQVADAYLKALRRLSPNLTDDKILGCVIMNPLDYERRNASSYHGSCNENDGSGGSPAQMGANRPVPGWADYRMPIPGLYQTGLCTHPGGGVTGGPGRNAAMVILKDFGTSVEEVVRKKESV
jgi:phytoene dehydrogenase-like protein